MSLSILIVTPVPLSSRRGNRLTSDRWANHLLEQGHQVQVAESYRSGSFDLLIALHAEKSACSILQFQQNVPDGRSVVIITGTDVNQETIPVSSIESMNIADRIVVLQNGALAKVPRHLIDKTIVIHQSSKPPANRPEPNVTSFEMTQIGHLRPVKDPFRGAKATQLLPKSSKIKLIHLGEALTQAMRQTATSLTTELPRYQWIGSVAHQESVQLLARSRATLLTSKSEGGAAVISEAIACSVPVLASRIDGNVGILGDHYSGYFDVGNTEQLAELMLKFEQDKSFQLQLMTEISELKPLVDSHRESQLIQQLIAELFE
ncbi:MAG: selenoneine biosynthesis selenosugar synthase SenB [Planctomycetota bacterium]